MHLSHCIYASVATHTFTRADLERLLAGARKNNERLGVTGMLLHVGASFFQVLEGDDAVVRRLFEQIGGDVRHADVTRIIHEPLRARQFGDWTMGFASLSPAELENMVGTNDFFTGRSCLTDIPEGRAKKLLSAFARGRWHLAPHAVPAA